MIVQTPADWVNTMPTLARPIQNVVGEVGLIREQLQRRLFDGAIEAA